MNHSVRSLLWLALIAGLMFFASPKAHGQCSCEPEATVDNHFRRSEHAFVGKVISTQFLTNTEDSKADLVIQFEVKIAWKQNLTKVIDVIEFEGSIEGFAPNSEWLVYAARGRDSKLHLFRGCCSRTKSLKVAKKQGDFRAFAQMGERAKRIL
jgi:hypothetical protein